MLDQIYKQLTALQKQLDNLVKPEILTTSELDLLYLQIVNNLSDVANAVASFDNIKQPATTTYEGVVERATDNETQTGTDTTRYITPANLSSRTATTTRTGIAELATDAEAQAMTDTERTLTPSNLAALSLAFPQAGRLTLTSGTPVLTSTVSAATTIYFTPYLGNRIALYTGSYWKVFAFSELSIAVPSTVYRLFDVFVYDNSGTLTLETVNWNQSTAAITGATNATPIVITSNGHGLSNGDAVAIVGVGGNTAANGVWSVANVATNTFELAGSTGSGAYTSGGTWYRLNETRATALTTQNGCYVKSGDATRLYLGTGMTTETSGQTESTVARRLLWNYYNRSKIRTVTSSTTSHTYTSTTQRIWNNDISLKAEVVLGISEDAAFAFLNGAWNFDAGDTANCNMGVGVNNTAGQGTTIRVDDVIDARNLSNLLALDPGDVRTGYNFLQATERGGATSPDFTQVFVRMEFAG